jgi:hypothetical protein
MVAKECSSSPTRAWPWRFLASLHRTEIGQLERAGALKVPPGDLLKAWHGSWVGCQAVDS